MEELGSPLWPIHLKPRPNELLSSWMIRLAHAHGYKTERMCRMLFGRDHALWSRDVDRLAPEAVLRKLAEITGTDLERSRSTTIEAYSGYLSGHISVGGHSPWIVPLYVYHRRRTAPGLMYCPWCLQSDEVAFYRRTWRLAFVTVCTAHGTTLCDTCPHCTSAVIPHRVDIGRSGATPRDRSFIRCWKCGFNLSSAVAAKCDDQLLVFTRKLETVVDSGFVHWDGNPSLHSMPYFAGLRVLARFAAKEERARQGPIETLILADRQAVLLSLARLQESWPSNFLTAVKQTRTTYSDIVGAREILPFWLEQVVDGLKRHQSPERGDAELAEIARIVSQQGRLSTAAARRLYGVNVRWQKIPITYRTVVSNENHETLMAILDQSAARTSDRKTRFAYLQDKVMFSLYRFTDLSTARICALKVADIPPLPGDSIVDGEWWNALCSRVEAIRALHRHVNGMRREFTGSEKCEYAFFSPYTGRPLRASGMQARFRLAISVAFLTAPVPNMGAYKLR
jgi:hypothetical protein